MTTAYVHIGVARSGTTTIAKFLRLNRERLRERGVLYPAVDGGTPYSALRAGAAETHRFQTDLLCEIEETKPNSIILSDEHLYGHLMQDGVEALRLLLSNCCDRVVISCYVRRQDEMMLSAWAYRVLWNQFKEPFSLPPPEKIAAWEYYTRLALWRSVFGDVVVRRYGPTYFVGGDLLTDHVSTLGLSMEGLERCPPQNQSLDAPRLEFLRRYNAITPDPLQPPFGELMRRGLLAGSGDGPRPGLSRAVRQEILDVLDATNRKVAVEFLGLDGPLFDHPVPDDPPVEPTTEQACAATADILRHFAAFLDRDAAEKACAAAWLG